MTIIVVISIIKKVFIIIKQGAKSVREAIDYVKKPENRKKSFGILMFEVGKIVITGLTAIGAMALGEAIEIALLSIPIFAVEIPLIGSLANILGIFLGAIVAGIAGALVLNLIDKIIAKKKKSELQIQTIDKSNEIIKKQEVLIAVSSINLENKKEETRNNIKERHEIAGKCLRESYETIRNNEERLDQSKKEFDSKMDELKRKLGRLQEN